MRQEPLLGRIDPARYSFHVLEPGFVQELAERTPCDKPMPALIRSIEESGVIDPISIGTADAVSERGMWKVRDGRRRLNIAASLCLAIPAVVIQGVQSWEAATLISNNHRSASPVTEYLAAEPILRSVNGDIRAAAERAGIPLARMRGYAEVSKLPKDLLDLFLKQKMSFSTARAAGRLSPAQKQRLLERSRIIAEDAGRGLIRRPRYLVSPELVRAVKAAARSASMSAAIDNVPVIELAEEPL